MYGFTNAFGAQKIDEVLKDIYRISAFDKQSGITFNEFLIVDEKPTLIETGYLRTFKEVNAQIAKIIDPSKLKYIVIPHFEADECGAINKFLEAAPEAAPVCSQLCGLLSITDQSIRDPIMVADGPLPNPIHSLSLGKRTLKFVNTPFVPHGWDSMLVYDEEDKALFTSDVFMQLGDVGPMASGDQKNNIIDVYEKFHLTARGPHVHNALEKFQKLNPKYIIPHHGSALQDNLDAYMKAIDQYFQP